MATEGKKVSLSKLNRSNTFEKIFDCIDSNFTKLANVINSGSLNTSIEIEEFIATEYQTNFTLQDTFIPGTNALTVYVNNARQWENSGFEEVGNQAFMLTTPAELGTLVKAVYIRTDPEYIKIDNVYDDDDIEDSSSTSSSSSGGTGVHVSATDVSKVNEAIRQIESMMIEVQSYVHGGTGSRRGESTDNATYLFNECQRMVREIRTLRDELKTTGYTVNDSGDVLVAELDATMIAYGQSTVDNTLKGFELTLQALQSLINSVDSARVKYKNTTVELKIDSIVALLSDFNNRLENTTVPTDVEEQIQRLQNNVTALSRAVSGTISANSIVYDDTGLTIVDELSSIERSIRTLDTKLNRESANISDEIEDTNKSIERLSRSITNLSEELTTEESNLDRLTRTVNGLISDIDALKTSEEDDTISSDKISVGRINLTEKLNQLTTFVTNLENSLSSTNTNLASVNRKINEVSDNYEIIESNMGSLDRKVTKQLNSMATEVDEVAESVNTLDRQTTRNIANLNTELQEVITSNNSLTQRMSSLTDRMETVEVLTGANDISNLNSGNVKLEGDEEKTVTNKFTDIDRKLDVLNTTSDLLTAKINNVSNKLNDLTEEDNDLGSDISALDRKITTNCRNMLDDIGELRSSFTTLETNTANQLRGISSGLDDSVALLEGFKRTTRTELNDIYERLESINQVQATLQSGEDIIISGRLTASDVKSGETNVQVILNELDSKADATDKKVTKLSADTTEELDSIKINITDLSNRIRQSNVSINNLNDSVDKNAEDIGKLNRYVDRLINEVRTESETFDSNVMRNITSIENRLTDINTNLEALNNATLSSGDLDSITTANLTASNISYGVGSNVKVKLDTLTNDLEYLNSRTSNKINEVKLDIETLQDKAKKLGDRVDALSVENSTDYITQNDLNANNVSYDSNYSVKNKIDDLTNNQEYIDLKYSTKTENLQRTTSVLDSDLKQANRDINSITGQLVTVNENISNLEAKATRISTSVSNLSNELTESISDSESVHREINRKITVLTNDLDLLDTDTKKDIRDLKTRIENLNVSISNLSSLSSSGNSSSGGDSQQVIITPTNASDIIYEESNVKVKLDELSSEIDELSLNTSKSINSVKSDLAELGDVVNSNNSKTSRTLTTLQSGVEEIDDSLTSLNSKTTRALSKVQVDLDTINDDVTYLTTRTNKSISNLQNSIELLETTTGNSIRNLSNRIENIAISINTITSSSGSNNNDNSVPITSLTATNVTYDNNLNVKQKIDSISDNLDAIDSKHSKSITKLQSSVSYNEENIETLSTKINTNTSRLQTNIDSISDELSSFSTRTNREINGLKIEDEDLRVDVDKNTRDIRTLNSRIDDLSTLQSAIENITLTSGNSNNSPSGGNSGNSSVPGTTVVIDSITAENVKYGTSNVKAKLDSLEEDIEVLNSNLTRKERTLQLNIETVEDSVNSLSSRTTKQINQLSERVDYNEEVTNNFTQRVTRKLNEFTDTLDEASDKIDEFDSKVTGLVTRDSIDAEKVIFEENSNVHDQLVEILGLLRQLTSGGQQDTTPSSSLLNMILPNNAGSHNGVFRGNNLGTSITREQSNAIKSGTFEDIFIGDYWVFRGKKYYVAGLDLLLNTGPDSAEDIYVEDTANSGFSELNEDNSFLTNFDDNPPITSTNDSYKLKDHHIILIPEEILDLNRALSVTDTLAASQDTIPTVITVPGPGWDDTVTTPGGDDTVTTPGGDTILPGEDVYSVPYNYVVIDSEGNTISSDNIIVIGTSEQALDESLNLTEASLTTRALNAVKSKESLISFLSETGAFLDVKEELTNRNSNFDNISIVTLFNVQASEEIQSQVSNENKILITFNVEGITTEDSILVLVYNTITNNWEITPASVIENGKILVEFNHFCLVMIFKVIILSQQGEDTVTTPGGDTVTVTTPGGDDTITPGGNDTQSPVTLEPDTVPSSIVTLPSGETPTIIGEGTLESLFGGIDLDSLETQPTTSGGKPVLPTIEVVDTVTGETVKSEIVIVEPAVLAYSDFDNGVFNGMFYNGSPNGIVVKPPVLITLTSGESDDSIRDSLISSSIGSGNATVIYGEDILKEETLPPEIIKSSEYDGGAYEKLVFNNLREKGIEINIDDFNSSDTITNKYQEDIVVIPDIPINIPVSESDVVVKSEFDNGYFNVMVYNGNKSVYVASDIIITDERDYVSIPNTPIEIPTIESQESKDNSLSEFDNGFYNLIKFNGESVSLQASEISRATIDTANEEHIDVPAVNIEIPTVGRKETINSGLDSGYYNQALFNGKGTSTVKPEVIIDSSEKTYDDYIEIPETKVSIPASESKDDSIDTSNDSRFNEGFYNVAKFDKFIEDTAQSFDSIEPTTTPSGFESQSGGLETLESGVIEVSVPVAIDNKVLSEFDKGIYNGLVFNGTGKGSEQLSQTTVKPADTISTVTTGGGLDTYHPIQPSEPEIEVPDIFIDIPTIEAESTVNSEWNSGVFNLMMYEGGIPSQIETVAPAPVTIPSEESVKPGDSITPGEGTESITTPSGEVITVKPVTPILEESSILPEVDISIVSGESNNSEFDSGNYNVMLFDGKDKSLVTLPSKEDIIQGGQGQATIVTQESIPSTSQGSTTPSSSIVPETSYVIYSSEFDSGYYNIVTFNSHTSISAEGIIEPEIAHNVPIITEDSVSGNNNLEDGEIPVTRVKVPTVEASASVDAKFNSGFYNVAKFDGTKIVPQIDKYATLGSEEQESVKNETVIIPEIPLTVPSTIIYSEFNYGKHNKLLLNGDKDYEIEFDDDLVFAQDKITQSSGQDTTTNPEDDIIIPDVPIVIPTIEPSESEEATIDSGFNKGYYNVMIYNGVTGDSLENTLPSSQDTVTTPSGSDTIEPSDTTPSGNESVTTGGGEEDTTPSTTLTPEDTTPSGQDTVTTPSGNDTVTIEPEPVEPEPSIPADTTSIFEYESGEFEVSIYDGKNSNDFLTQFAISDNLTFDGHRKSWYTRKTFEDEEGNLYSKWIEVDYRLLTEVAVFGARIHGKAERTEITSQFPIFKLSPEFIRIGQDYWLSDMVAKSNNICMVTKDGESFYADAEEIKGIRPFFVIG